ncbi:hypothetical protein HDU85_004184 [Gaertneriomyces sp. JEL0708]|nr:hypothetical protein HDU85_004184 [Gaertneriomyces sp. JEL0708]
MTGEKFVLPVVQDHNRGWGPAQIPEEFADVPYAPFSKSDRLGKIADWSVPAGGQDGYYDRRDGEYRRRRFGQQQEAFGAGLASVFSYSVAGEDEDFTTVDRSSTTQKKTGGRTTRGGRGGARGGFGWQARGGGARRDGRGGYQGPRRRFGGYNDKPVRIRESSVQIGEDWRVIEELDFPRMTKLYYEVEEAEDLSANGTLNYFDKQNDRVSTKAEKTLQQIDRNFLNVTSSEDPVLLDLAAKDNSEGTTIYATDNILAALMASTRAVYSFDIVISKQDGKIFFDKRDGGAFDFLSVNENAADPPMESPDKDNINTPQALAMEATYINRNFSQQVLKDNEKVEFKQPNPFVDPNAPEPTPSLAYRYRKWDLGDNIHLVARTQIDTVVQHSGVNNQQFVGPLAPRNASHSTSDSLLVNVKALNEFDSRATGSGAAPDWRQKLDSQRGAVMATELKNNGNKIARWTLEALLAGVDQLRLGFVSRANPKDRTRHVILGTSTLKPKDLAQQMNVSVGNAWGILKMFADFCVNNLEDGKFVLVKDPNKALLRLYAVPEDAFDEGEEMGEHMSEIPGEDE